MQASTFIQFIVCIAISGIIGQVKSAEVPSVSTDKKSAVQYEQVWKTSIEGKISVLDSLYFEPRYKVIEYYAGRQYIGLEKGEILSNPQAQNIKIKEPVAGFDSIYRGAHHPDYISYIVLDNGDRIGYQKDTMIKWQPDGKIVPCEFKDTELVISDPYNDLRLRPLIKGRNTVMSPNGLIWSADGQLQYQITLKDRTIANNPYAMVELKDYFVVNTNKGKKEKEYEEYPIKPKVLIFAKKNEKSTECVKTIREHYERLFKIGKNKVLLVSADPAFSTIIDLSQSKIRPKYYDLPANFLHCHPIALKSGLWGLLARIDTEKSMSKVVFQVHSPNDTIINEFEVCSQQELKLDSYQLCTIDTDGNVYVGWRAKKHINVASYKPVYSH